MTLTQIKYFETVCVHGNATKAAEGLYISRPVISRALRELEREFGVVLFERTRTGLELTQNGRILRNLFNEFSGAYTLMQERIRHLEIYRARRTITMGITPTIGRFLPNLCIEFHNVYPDIDVCVKEIPCYESRASVVEGKTDVFFTPVPTQQYSMIGETELYSSKIVFCTSNADPMASREEIPIAETLDLPLATFLSSMPVDGCRNIILKTSQQDIVRKTVAAGFAYAILPQDMVEEWEGITCVPLVPEKPYTVRLIWNKTVPHNSAFDDFMCFMEHYDLTQIIGPE